MTKLTFFKGLSAFLLVINLAVIGIMLRQHRPGPPMGGKGPRNEIIRKLQFDNLQTKQYDELISRHRSEIDSAQSRIKALKNLLYSQLKEVENSNKDDSVIAEINKVQLSIEYIHLHHFQDIKKLCKPEQQKYFNDLTTEIARLFSPHPRDRK